MSQKREEDFWPIQKMSFTGNNTELWRIILEKCTYREVRRLFMTGSKVVRQAVMSLQAIKVRDFNSRACSVKLAYSLPNLRHMAITPGLAPPDAPSTRHTLLGCSELLTLELEKSTNGYRTYELSNNLAKQFPQLETLIQPQGMPFNIQGKEKFVKNLPKNITRLLLPRGEFDAHLLQYLPTTLTELEIVTFSAVHLEYRDAGTPSISSSLIPWPPALTRLWHRHSLSFLPIFENLPSTLTDLTVENVFLKNSDWKPLPPLLTSFCHRVCAHPLKLLPCLPPSLLSLQLQVVGQLGEEFIQQLPPSLTFLSLKDYSQSPLRDWLSSPFALQKLPPNLTALGSRISGPFHDQGLSTFDVEINETELRQILERVALSTSATRATSGTEISASKPEHMRVAFLSDSYMLDSKDLELHETNEISEKVASCWIIPERFRRVFYLADPAAPSIRCAPKTTTNMLIADCCLEETESTQMEWQYAKEHVLRNLYRLKHLDVGSFDPNLKGIVDGIESNCFSSIKAPMICLSEKTKFPSTLRQAEFLSYLEKPETGFIQPRDLLRALPQTLTSLTIRNSQIHSINYEISAELFPLFPRSLITLECLMTYEGDSVAQQFEHLPRGLEHLRLQIPKIFDPFTLPFAAALLSPLLEISLQFFDAKSSIFLKEGIKNTDFFLRLPKALEIFSFNGTLVLEQRHSVRKGGTSTLQ